MADQPETTTDETTHAPASAPVSTENAPSSEQPSEASEASHADEGEGAGETEGEGEEGEASSAGETAAEGAGPGGEKKKRRRRRKKKGAGEGASAEGGPRPDHEHARPEPRRDLPLSRFFDGAPQYGHGRGKSPFTAGDIVGGIVVSVERGVSVIDLFGRGIAFAQANEPRALPVAPAEPEEHEHDAATDAQASDPSAVGNAAAEMEGHVGMPASESLPPPPPMSAGDVAVPHVADEAPDAVQSDPALVGRAARALRRVGTPQIDHEHETNGHGHPALEETGTSAGEHPTAEEAAAHDAASEEPMLVVGDVFRGRVASVAENGTMAINNRSVIKAEARAGLAKAREEHRRVFGMVFGYNRGGFDVLVEGLRAFCPVSGLTLEHLESADSMIGQRLEFSVQAAKGGQQGVVVSRRSILEREARKRAKEIRKSLQPGQKMKGRVTQVREFGIFVDIGGVEGLVHMSEVSWDRSVRPEQAAKVGDIVDVQILRIGEGPPPRRDQRGDRGERSPEEQRESKRDERRKSDRVALSMKAVQPDPWHTLLEGIAEGTAHKGKITRTTEFGAFVELVPGIEGLLHITEIGQNLRHASERVKEGEELVVVVERVDIKGHRISLSRMSKEDEKAFLEGTLEAPTASGGKAVRPGALLKVKVDRIESGGLYVQIEGVIGKRGRGFIPNVEMGTERGTDHRKKFPIGTEIDVKVVGLDRDGGWRMSRKGFAQEEERRAIQDYRREASQKGFGTFGDILARKLKPKA
jgi:small subunit ribosomal protein S1